MKLWELEEQLQGVEGFDVPKVELEQYITGPHIAARILHTIDTSFEGLEDAVVADLGCGTVGPTKPFLRDSKWGFQGVLSLGCGVLDAACVIGVDIDSEALQIAQRNIQSLDPSLPVGRTMREGNGAMWRVEFVCADVEAIAEGALKLESDVVVMNPPFGTKKKNADRIFLQAAFQVAHSAVYSLHKTSTRSFIQKLADRSPLVESAQVVAELRYDLPATLKFHKSNCKDIEVDFWRFQMQNKQL